MPSLFHSSRYSLLFLIYCTCLIVQESLNFQTTISPTFHNLYRLYTSLFYKNFILLLPANRLCSLAVSLYFATILLMLSNSLFTAWLCLFFLATFPLLLLTDFLTWYQSCEVSIASTKFFTKEHTNLSSFIPPSDP